jgi:hypothetical protein
MNHYLAAVQLLLLAAIVALMIRSLARRRSQPEPQEQRYYRPPAEHQVDNLDCWCEPELFQVCPEWSGVEWDHCPSSCWRCRGKGWVEPYDDMRVTVVVHRVNRVRRRP